PRRKGGVRMVPGAANGWPLLAPSSAASGPPAANRGADAIGGLGTSVSGARDDGGEAHPNTMANRQPTMSPAATPAHARRADPAPAAPAAHAGRRDPAPAARDAVSARPPVDELMTRLR